MEVLVQQGVEGLGWKGEEVLGSQGVRKECA